jgi:hypothetical protein
MSLLEEGIWPCTVLSANSGQDDKGAPQVQISVRIDDGPSKGRQCTYEDQVNNKSAPYVGRSCKAVGWKGNSLVTLHDDCEAWITSTGGKSTVEIKHLEIKTGKRAGQIWDKPNSIGRGPRVLKEMDQRNLADADEVLRNALNADTSGGYDDDVPHAGSRDDIPFASSAFSAEPAAIARVLRGAL